MMAMTMNTFSWERAIDFACLFALQGQCAALSGTCIWRKLFRIFPHSRGRAQSRAYTS
jgi:hypothetical protein